MQLFETKLYVPVVTLSTKNDKTISSEQNLKEVLNGINIGQK